MKYLIFALLIFASVPCFSLSEADRLEISRASEGAPSHVTKDATFLKFKGGKFIPIKQGKNKFTCAVVHDPNGRYEPSCFNEPAVRTILPAYELHMKSLYEGKSYDETYKIVGEAFRAGKLPTAETAALVYMMSPNNKMFYNGKLYPTPVHHMYFYPKLKSDVFSLGEGSVSLWQGFPHLSAVIVTIDKPEDHNKANHGTH
ncbi:chromate transporter [Pseudoalteromonas sp. PPB1]|uniref:chromate transporter n=1 Tax=Pseudoalteromonas sp. PPB1 TaxID=2756136 RepID=UPI001891C1E7|nr:chromate transporter [Pseudoalteromonas sp. PPB1]